MLPNNLTIISTATNCYIYPMFYTYSLGLTRPLLPLGEPTTLAMTSYHLTLGSLVTPVTLTLVVGSRPRHWLVQYIRVWQKLREQHLWPQERHAMRQHLVDINNNIHHTVSAGVMVGCKDDDTNTTCFNGQCRTRDGISNSSLHFEH